MKLFAPAKLNICLDILGKDTNRYHKIRTVFIEYNEVRDEIEILNTQEKDNIAIPNSTPKISRFRLPNQEENLAFKALKKLKQKFSIKKNAQIIIKKQIPISSGLGGASSDAATILKGLNQLWNLNLSIQELLNIAKELGADVPFFILGGTALGENYGEILTPLPEIKCLKFSLNPQEEWPPLPSTIEPKHKTGQMYESLDLSKCNQNNQKTEKIIQGIKAQDTNLILKNLHNDFETLLPVPTGKHLSGSGPATFQVACL